MDKLITFNFASFLIMMFLLTTASFCAQAQSAETFRQYKTEGGGSLKVYYYEEPIFAYTNSKGELTGIAIDVMNVFLNYVEKSEKISIEPEYIKMTVFPAFYNAVKNSSNAVLGAGSITITEDRKQEIDFSPSFFNNKAVLLTNTNVAPAEDKTQIGEMLEGKTMWVYEGTTQESYYKHIKNTMQANIEVKYVKSDEAVLNAILANSSHFGCVDLPVLIQAIKQDLPVIYQAKADIKGENFGFITPKDSGWQKKLDDFFNLGYGFKSSNMFRNIVQKHMGDDLDTFINLAKSRSSKKIEKK